MNPLAEVGALATLLNSALDAEATLQRAAEIIRRAAGTSDVTIWYRAVGAPAMHRIAAPADAPGARGADPRRDFDEMAPGPGTVRTQAVREAEVIAWLDAAEPVDNPGVLAAAAPMIAAYLTMNALTADTARRLAEQSQDLDEQQRFTALVIDSLPVGLYVVDREYRIRMWNRKRETGTQGLRRADVVDRAVFDVLTRQPREQLKGEFDAVFASGEIRENEMDVPVGGEVRSYHLTKIPMRLDGDEITHVITIGDDVTARHSARERLLQNEKLAAIGQLAAGVMHEINNPLAIIGACAAAAEGRLEDVTGPGVEAIREYCELIDKEVQRCTRIVDELLDFSRPKGKAKHRVAIAELVDDTLFLLKHHQRFRTLTVTREFAERVPSVLANPEQLIQVCMAVMLNAADAMEGGGELTVRVGGGARPDEVAIEIEDRGDGIPISEQSKIFEPFYTTKPPGRGTGLGLSICYGIVQEHQGRLEVDSVPGRGSTFRIVLPVHPETA